MKNFGIKTNHFPRTIFAITLGVFLLVGGVNVGLVLLVLTVHMKDIPAILLILGYWGIVSAGFAYWIKHLIQTYYEEPMQKMAQATNAVAGGDFSVYMPPIHMPDSLDYLDVMIMDFNKMVEELGSIETLKTDFFSNVSHEIKTPIAVIQNTAELLKKPDLDEETRQEYVNTIIQSSKKLSALITNILKLNKLEKQNIQPEIAPYDICEQLCECALQFEDTWEKKEIDFEVDLEDSREIESDANLLELVWTNLLSNAMKFTEPGGKVCLTQTMEGDEIKVAVSDTGCGIDKEAAKHIFDKFYQGDTSHSTEGNGLGLALCYRIVQMMHGRIEVESEEGKGTTFLVYLPKKQQTEKHNQEKRKGRDA